VSARAWIGIGAATCAAVAAAALWPQRSHAIVAAWAIGVLAWGLLRAVGGALVLARGGRSTFEGALASSVDRTARPDDLARCERVFGWKSYPARDFDHHVRPLLKELIEHRIGERGRSGPAFELGPELTALMEGAEAEAVYGTSISTEDVDRILERIERL
jgi:hypothetical protein